MLSRKAAATPRPTSHCPSRTCPGFGLRLAQPNFSAPSFRQPTRSRCENGRSGWFGDLAPTVRPRIGDVVVACRDDLAIQYPSVFPYEPHMIGMHGSLTSAEMLIPVLVA